MNSNLRKRLLKEYKEFSKNPLYGCEVYPREESFNVWDCLIFLNETELLLSQTIPIHLVVMFGENYPIDAPQV